jgi:NAD+ synthase (glutamine-hydrolysing)
MRTLRIALAQINTTIGDLDGNAAKIVDWTSRARDLGADVVAFPELAVTGYPPEDLVLRRSFVEDNLAALEEMVAPATAGICAIVGFIDLDEDVYNAAAIISDGKVFGRYHKQFLPNYGVFDEDRYFQRGSRSPVYRIAGVDVGVNICEDIWYPDGPARDQARAGAEVIININGSPYHRGKGAVRENMISTRASDNLVAVCYVNMTGGQDELVFDGHSIICDERGELVARAAQFREELLVHDIDIDGVMQTRLHDPRTRKERRLARDDGRAHIVVSEAPSAEEKPAISPRIAPLFDPVAEVWEALVLATRDYIHKTGFETVCVGLSGGIDSSVVAAVAAEALGPEHVVGVSMPSRFSSEGSRSDAKLLADNCGIRYMSVPIEGAFVASLEMLSDAFKDTEFGVAEENLQARIRGNILMSLSNKFGWLVLTTGNKSELATGYCTLYGDMAGGYAVVKDVPKTLVYELAKHQNRIAGREVIPQTVITKPPSAELRADQLDTDSLPPYEVLDPILEAYVEDDRTLDEIIAQGYDEATVRRIVRMVDRNEYKRRQAPVGVKITPRAFGRDRRLPIANRYQPR